MSRETRKRPKRLLCCDREPVDWRVSSSSAPYHVRHSLSPASMIEKVNISFAGCGFLGFYHIGVSSCIKEYAPHLLLNKIAGASMGAIAATCLLSDLSLGKLYVVVAFPPTSSRRSSERDKRRVAFVAFESDRDDYTALTPHSLLKDFQTPVIRRLKSWFFEKKSSSIIYS